MHFRIFSLCSWLDWVDFMGRLSQPCASDIVGILVHGLVSVKQAVIHLKRKWLSWLQCWDKCWADHRKCFFLSYWGEKVRCLPRFYCFYLSLVRPTSCIFIYLFIYFHSRPHVTYNIVTSYPHKPWWALIWLMKACVGPIIGHKSMWLPHTQDHSLNYLWIML